jgi:NADH-quinone oxidoreductase subunit C
MTFEQILEQIKSVLTDSVITNIDEAASPKAIVIGASSLIKVMTLLHDNENLYFDSLSCLTGLDNGEEAGKMEVIYNLYSIPFDHHLMIKVIVDRVNPVLPTITSIWKTADWQEREAYDMLGIKFDDHPDLRRILMPADWDGFPLRKDYKEQEYYRGIKVDY